MKRSLVVAPHAPRHPLRAMMSPPDAQPTVEQRPQLSDLAFFITSFIAGFIIIFGMIA